MAYYGLTMVYYGFTIPFSSYLTLNNIVTLKSRLQVTHSHRNFKLVPFKSLGTVSYSPYIVALSCIVCEIIFYSDLLVENREICIPRQYLSPP